jgi:TRAP-type mannitol/chloroaromatic compound transport system permease large subunit
VLAQLAKGLVPPLALVLAVLGSIFLGVVSPSEAAGVGALGATLLAVLRRRLDLATLREVSRATTRTTAFIFAIFLGATCFAVVLRGLGGDEVIAAAITALPFGATGVVLALMGLVFVLGFFLDWIEITLIVLPLVEPVTASLGIDKLWFTVLGLRTVLPEGRGPAGDPARSSVSGGRPIRAAPAAGPRRPLRLPAPRHLAAGGGLALS